MMRNVTVVPTQEILQKPGGAFFRGGPIWPWWALQVRARQCRGLLPRPVDSRPRPAGPPEAIHEEGAWCGPLVEHYGHAIADFGMRIAGSVTRFPAGMPLVFCAPADPGFREPGYFREILAQLRVDPARVLVVRRPALFRRLHVLPQAERMDGGGPSEAHLDLMDRLTGDARAVPKDIGVLYVSRAGQLTGRLAGESYLDTVLTRAGVRVFHPEFSGLPEQVAFYARARSLVFAEGSAIHTLQLMGHLGVEIAVLVRRPRQRIAEASLRPRADRLRYLDALHGIVYGRRRSGQTYPTRGISVLRDDKVIACFRQVGVDLAPFWDGDAFRAARDADIAAWMDFTRKLALHPRAMETAQACLRHLGITIEA
ncbi:glycosyltransferase 61 family protein [Methylobacterium organophilum]|uniref:Glycosyltransferase 61 catalytic domain-containing protein n=1 Tax=Methylobacterium organophilum TaxID=410 RepID=A0ABQ4TB53_METOR|nr:glycosyltransferase 61 family protein [Methylobacterium organophilum]GJE27859.1 hypothetical protein LKMONMHP_2721 [Methylobacterium organophilum]